MTSLLYLIPLALLLGALGLAAFLWSLNSGQYDDLDGAAHRILFDDEDEAREVARSQERPDKDTEPAKTPDRPPDRTDRSDRGG